MKRRELSDEDRELWERVKRAAEPLHPARLDFPPRQTKPKSTPKPQREIMPFSLGERARATKRLDDLAPSISERFATVPLRMDQKKFGKMKRGKFRPEGTLDLHGMTLASAHPALIRFVTDAYGAGKRLVLVVTGKGKTNREDGPIPIRRGVLKHQVPSWLAQPPLGALILQVTEAHQSHGGSGAYYIYLRRARSL